MRERRRGEPKDQKAKERERENEKAKKGDTKPWRATTELIEIAETQTHNRNLSLLGRSRTSQLDPNCRCANSLTASRVLLQDKSIFDEKQTAFLIPSLEEIPNGRIKRKTKKSDIEEGSSTFSAKHSRTDARKQQVIKR